MVAPVDLKRTDYRDERRDAFIFDTDGDVVWWYEPAPGESTDGVAQAKMSADGQSLWLVNEVLSGAPLRRVSIDGLTTQTYENTSASHAVAAVGGDTRITTEFYAHLAPGYLRNAIDRLAIPSFVTRLLPEHAARLAVLQGGGDRLLSVREAARQLGLCKATIYGLCADGALPHMRILNAIRIAPVDLTAFIAARRR